MTRFTHRNQITNFIISRIKVFMMQCKYFFLFTKTAFITMFFMNQSSDGAGISRAISLPDGRSATLPSRSLNSRHRKAVTNISTFLRAINFMVPHIGFISLPWRKSHNLTTNFARAFRLWFPGRMFFAPTRRCPLIPTLLRTESSFIMMNLYKKLLATDFTLRLPRVKRAEAGIIAFFRTIFSFSRGRPIKYLIAMLTFIFLHNHRLAYRGLFVKREVNDYGN